MKNGVNSVEDIDALLADEFNLVDTDDEDLDDTLDDESQNASSEGDVSTNISQENDVDDSSQEDENSSDNGTTEQNDNVDNTQTTKPDVDAKKEYSFAQLRKENAEVKAKLKAATANEEALKRIASQYGYDNAEDFVKAYDEARMAQEAKQKGIDPVIYKQLQDSNKRIAELEAESRNAKLMEKANEFKIAVESAVKNYNLGENGRNEIFTKLEEAGYTVDTILSLPNPEIVIKGVLSDKIAEISKQKQIDKLQDLDNIADDKLNDGSSTKSFNIDDFIEQDLKEYKANNYYE